jgi:hypothetical protein
MDRGERRCAQVSRARAKVGPKRDPTLTVTVEPAAPLRREGEGDPPPEPGLARREAHSTKKTVDGASAMPAPSTR